MKRPAERAFSHLGGVHLAGTHVTCDATGSASDLVFLSHALAVGVVGKGKVPLARSGRQQLLATEATLALLGLAGTRLRRYALPAAFGRPFNLGESRLELFSSGHLPGAASLLCETGGRRLVYAGTIRRGRPGLGALPLEIRSADAVCLDATFGDPRFSFPPAEESLGNVIKFVKECLAAGVAPVLLTQPLGTAMEVAAALAAAGFALRGHRQVVATSVAYRAAGLSPPIVSRFADSLGANEVLLWPPEHRDATMLARLPGARFAFISGFSRDPATLAAMRVELGVPLASQSGFEDLLAYAAETGAREIAVHRGFCEELAAALRARGHDAYPLGAPRQMELFRG